VRVSATELVEAAIDRIEVLHEDIEQFDQHGDAIASRSATAELDVLLHQLSAAAGWAVGTGGWATSWIGLERLSRRGSVTVSVAWPQFIPSSARTSKPRSHRGARQLSAG
jgi:hypothetical protein